MENMNVRPVEKHLVLVDGMSFLFRAYHGIRSGMTRADGMPTNALYGFSQMLLKVVGDLKPTHAAVVLDSPPPTFRHAMYDKYKANRPPPDPELKVQLELVEPLVRAFGIPILREQGVEADDLIASACIQHPDWKITVVSSDKDLLQLVTPNVHLLDTMKDVWLGEEAVVAKFGVPARQVVEVQGLMGDSSDNIPGVRGVGPKTAAELIGQFGSLEAIYADLGAVKSEGVRAKLLADRENAFLSRELARLKTDCVLPLEGLVFHPKLHEAAGFLREVLEFKSLAARLEKEGARELGNKGAREEEKVVGEGEVAWGNYECVTTWERWQWWLDAARAQGWVGFDTETTSLNPLDAKLVGVSLALAPGQACYVPVGHGESAGGLDFGAEKPVQLDLTMVLADVLALAADVVLIAHNLKYDWQVLAAVAGVTPADTGVRLQTLLPKYEDTLLLSASLHGGKWNHALDGLARRHLGHEMIAYETVCGKGKAQVTFDRVALDVATAYAAEDADAVVRLWLLLKEELAEAEGPRAIYETVERPLLPLIVALESRGVCVNVGALRVFSGTLLGAMEDLERRAHGLVGTTFNLNSPSQVGVVLFDTLKLGTPAQQKKRSTDAGVLEELSESEGVGGELAKLLLEYRQLAKLRSTYAEALPQQVQPRTGRVHTHYHQMGAATGRFSSSDPNLQNIPIRTELGRGIRRAFVPRAGWVMVSADYSQIELRLLAHFSGAVALREAFLAGADIHAATASQVFGKPLAEVSKEERRVAKIINFGLVYGMGARSMAGQLGVSVGEAASWIAAWFNRYDGVRQYMDGNKKMARERGWVTTLLGRRVWLPEIANANAGLRAGAERAAINAPLQGSNADVIKLAMPRVEAALREVGLQATMLMQVHDELVLECPPEEVETLRTLLPAVMGGVVQLAVPLLVEVGVGGDWESAH